jgi:release factor glutamine methyltransferase
MPEAALELQGLTVGSAIHRLSAAFERAGLPTPALDARLLAAHSCGFSREETISKGRLALSPAMAGRLSEAAARRLAGEPVSRIVGRREFWGLSFALSPHTLDPRPETELLVEAVLGHVRERALGDRPLRVLDLGTGSGCLIAALLSELPQSIGVALDLNERALSAARENLRALGLLPRAAFLCGKWANSVGGASFDIIVSNPPYIASSEIEGLGVEVKNYDPRLALDGGIDGLDAYRAIFAQAFQALRPEGYIVVETGVSQAHAVRDMMMKAAAQSGSLEATIFTDLNGIERAVAGLRQSSRRAAGPKKKIGNPALSG